MSAIEILEKILGLFFMAIIFLLSVLSLRIWQTKQEMALSHLIIVLTTILLIIIAKYMVLS